MYNHLVIGQDIQYLQGAYQLVGVVRVKCRDFFLLKLLKSYQAYFKEFFTLRFTAVILHNPDQVHVQFLPVNPILKMYGRVYALLFILNLFTVNLAHSCL